MSTSQRCRIERKKAKVEAVLRDPRIAELSPGFCRLILFRDLIQRAARVPDYSFDAVEILMHACEDCHAVADDHFPPRGENRKYEYAYRFVIRAMLQLQGLTPIVESATPQLWDMLTDGGVALKH